MISTSVFPECMFKTTASDSPEAGESKHVNANASYRRGFEDNSSCCGLGLTGSWEGCLGLRGSGKAVGGGDVEPETDNDTWSQSRDQEKIRDRSSHAEGWPYITRRAPHPCLDSESSEGELSSSLS